MSRAELEEISEGLITTYANKFSNRVIQSIDIEHFITEFLLAEKEQGRRRFTMAHEASHHILSKMYAMPSEGRFHAEYDSERSYSKEELAQMFASVE